MFIKHCFVLDHFNSLNTGTVITLTLLPFVAFNLGSTSENFQRKIQPCWDTLVASISSVNIAKASTIDSSIFVPGNLSSDRLSLIITEDLPLGNVFIISFDFQQYNPYSLAQRRYPPIGGMQNLSGVASIPTNRINFFHENLYSGQYGENITV
uniref:Uncharacterized protein n=1 Tax=Ciona intestinalis TaxID=7719 RepID=H2XP57_CIOIN